MSYKSISVSVLRHGRLFLLCVFLSPGCDSASGLRLKQSSLDPVFQTKEFAIAGMAFSPDNQILYAAQADGKLLAWDIQQKISIPLEINCDGEPTCIRIHPNGTMIGMATRSGNVELWDAKTSKRLRILSGVSKYPSSICFSPMGDSVLATYTYGSKSNRSGEYESGLNPILVWDIHSGRLIRRFDGHKVPVAEAVFSVDDNYVFSAAGEYSNNALLQWEIKTGEIAKKYTGHQGGFRGLALSQDNQSIIACTFSGQILRWDVDAPNKPIQFRATKGGIWTFKADSDCKIAAVGTGHLVVSSFSDKPLVSFPSDCYVKLFDMETQRKLAAIAHQSPVAILALSSDASTLASYTKEGMNVWNLCFY